MEKMVTFARVMQAFRRMVRHACFRHAHLATLLTDVDPAATHGAAAGLVFGVGADAASKLLTWVAGNHGTYRRCDNPPASLQ